MTDWYTQNIYLLAKILSSGPLVFALVYTIINMRVRQHFFGSGEVREVALFKAHTRVIRILSLGCIVLQTVLGISITKFPSTNSTYSFALIRPVLNVTVYSLGFMTSTHGAFRLAYILLLSHIVVTDTFAEVSIAMVINCLEREGMRCGDSALSLSLNELIFLKRRELVSLFLTPWILLETAYLCVAIGFCSNRYSSRLLSHSRPTFNIKTALLTHFSNDTIKPESRRYHSR
ncbi:uncharacterized protein PHALS_04916 [Plasmopara halstedii]|uniref:Uncharacterized protein n=1 Tax=Plasmopara halstedii TaxID=4781 RepID=A0A0P1A9C8_PLAHL|nr:uncharacterized protein PHALS_04916 [Plasmopara halstedii]CEG37314.1 hypothetical protein PHALS_04916 [Plasmopara halstedii]|eukprot:XP_024573683.1 hypothetical protein PHALS_04916 [Plasmopara halstedii]